MPMWKMWFEMLHRAQNIFFYSINSLILLWCGLITGLFCWAVSGRWFHSHNVPQLLLTTSWFLHFLMYGFLGPRPPRITHGRVVSSTRPRSLRHHLKALPLYALIYFSACVTFKLLWQLDLYRVTTQLLPKIYRRRGFLSACTYCKISKKPWSKVHLKIHTKLVTPTLVGWVTPTLLTCEHEGRYEGFCLPGDGDRLQISTSPLPQAVMLYRYLFCASINLTLLTVPTHIDERAYFPVYRPARKYALKSPMRLKTRV